MLEAAGWAVVAGSSLVLGALAALWRRWPPFAVGMIMAFGSGVLISSVAFDLVEEALQRAGGGPTTVGMAAGALAYYAGDLAVSRPSSRSRKSLHPAGHPGARAAAGAGATAGSEGDGGDGPPGGTDDEGAGGPAIVVGAVLDGIPESAAIGMSLLEGGGVAAAFVVAVFLSDLPEGLAATTGMVAAGRSRRTVLAMWTGVVAVLALSSALGYVLLDGAGDGTIAGLSAFAAGAVLTMVASTMLPEAHREGGATIGLVTTAGFLLAVLLGSVATG